MIRKMSMRYSLIFAVLSLLTYLSAGAQEKDYQPIRRGSEQLPPPQPPPVEKEKPTKVKPLVAQESKGKWDWNNFRLGGNLGLGLGNVTFVDISPTFGYFVIPQKLQVGIGTKFIYYNSRFSYSYIDAFGNIVTVPPYKTFIYGGGFFSNYTIWQGLFAHAEFEMINKDSYFDINKRVNVPHLLLGGGYMQPIGRSGNFFIAALFNVLDSDESLYTGTFGNLPLIIRTGFGFGFPGGGRR
jgi:hypothetical protein